MHAFRNLSIRTKLMSSMLACLLLFVAISTTLGFVLTGASLRERVVGQELPAVVGRSVTTSCARSARRWPWPDPWPATAMCWTGKLRANPRTAMPRGPDTPRRSSSRPGLPRCSGCRAARASTLASRVTRRLAPKGQGDQWFYEPAGRRQVAGAGDRQGRQLQRLYAVHQCPLRCGPGQAGHCGPGPVGGRLAQAVRAYQVGESGSVSLVRGNGSILVHRDPALVDGKHWLRTGPASVPGSALRC